MMRTAGAASIPELDLGAKRTAETSLVARIFKGTKGPKTQASRAHLLEITLTGN